VGLQTRVSDGKPVRVAAVADIHLHEGSQSEWRSLLDQICEAADILVLPGDLTRRGLPSEAEVLAESLAGRHLSVVAVLGNHDVEGGEEQEVVRILCQAGVTMLDEEPCEIGEVGFAGRKGFCGGFDRHALAPFGETLIKQFVHESVEDALKLEAGLQRLRTPHKIAVIHYAPVRATVEGEPAEIFPFLGSSRLADPLDHVGVSVALHGHAHSGTHQGTTTTGIPVYNVALPIMQRLHPERPFLVVEF
jgi:Icc-related predicted phosphoesterase